MKDIKPAITRTGIGAGNIHVELVDEEKIDLDVYTFFRVGVPIPNTESNFNEYVRKDQYDWYMTAYKIKTDEE